MKNKKVVIVTDWIYAGGGEKVVEQIHKIYPDAPIFASFCTEAWRKRLDNKVVTGYLNDFPFDKLRKFLPVLRQRWYKKLDLSEFDIIISVTGNGEAKFVKKQKENAVHICYCHTPVHFYWRKYEQYIQNPGFGKLDFLARIGLRILVKPLRKKDFESAQDVDFFIANSKHIRSDIKEFYGRDSKVIHPPVNSSMFSKFKLDSGREYFILWGRHVPDKRFDLAIKACEELGEKLVVIGSGSETENLKKIAGKNTEFTGFLSEEQMANEITKAKAFLFTSMEDFGIAPVEAMASGLPVIAYRAGGALDSVVENMTGVYFDDQSVESIKKAIKDFDHTKFDSSSIKKWAENFSDAKFRREFERFVDRSVKQ